MLSLVQKIISGSWEKYNSSIFWFRFKQIGEKFTFSNLFINTFLCKN